MKSHREPIERVRPDQMLITKYGARRIHHIQPVTEDPTGRTYYLIWWTNTGYTVTSTLKRGEYVRVRG